MNKNLIIVPTYNESQNINNLIELINGLAIKVDFLIIDDNSPDGTADIIRSLMDDNNNINLIVQNNKMGLGTAYKKDKS